MLVPLFRLRSAAFILALTIITYIISRFLPILSPIIVGFILGIIVGNTYAFSKEYSKDFSGIGSKALELSVVFLAFSIHVAHLKELGLSMMSIVVVTLLLVMILTVAMARWFRCPNSTAWLTGFGTALCGSSAIAAITPIVTKNKQDTAIALAVVNLLGSLAMLLMPFILGFSSLSSEFKGLLIGGSLHSVGNVAGAAYVMDKDTGDIAIAVKMARVALLSPSLFFFQWMVMRKQTVHWKQYLKLPLYLSIFIFITILGAFITFPPALVKFMEETGKIILVISMIAIGLNVRITELIRSCRKAMVYGILVFIIQVLLLLLFAYIVGF